MKRPPAMKSLAMLGATAALVTATGAAIPGAGLG